MTRFVTIKTMCSVSGVKLKFLSLSPPPPSSFSFPRFVMFVWLWASQYGSSALIIAARERREDIARILIEAGASLEAADVVCL